MVKLVREKIYHEFRINFFSYVKITRTRNGIIRVIFELTYGRKKYNDKIFLSVSEFWELYRYIKAVRDRGYPITENTLMDYDNKCIKCKVLLNTPSYAKSIHFGIWWKKSESECIPTRFRFAFHNEFEIERFLDLKVDYQEAFNECERVHMAVETCYLVLGDGLEEYRGDNNESSDEKYIEEISFDKFQCLLEKRSKEKVHLRNFDVRDLFNYIQTSCKQNLLEYFDVHHPMNGHSEN